MRIIKTQKKVGIYTLGCRVSQYESDAIAQLLESRGYTIAPIDEICDAYIVNTCAVTAESSRKSGQIIRRLIRKNKDAFIIVMGCFPQTEPERVSAIDGVDIIIGSEHKSSAVDMLDRLFENGNKNHAPRITIGDFSGKPEFEKMSLSQAGRTRAFIKIEDGCSNKCSYCIIPRARGPVRSKMPEDVLEEARTLADNGYREIVLAGIETSAYEYGLAELLKRVSEIKGIERIRMSSLDPAFVRKNFIDDICTIPQVMPHFHLSVQSGSSKILALMRRQYNAETALSNIEYIKKKIPEVMFSADFITGFPHEYEEDYLETEEFVKKVGFLHLHVFPFSPRAGTEAAQMSEQTDKAERDERARRLIALGEQIKNAQLEKIIAHSKIYPVLTEENKNGYTVGRLPSFAEIRFISERSHGGEICRVQPIEIKDGELYGVEK